MVDDSGACSTVQSISPSSARLGTSAGETIHGFGFQPGTAVSFESGNGARPTASNVEERAGGVLRAAFTVTR